jgi:glucose-1-phosphate cytidylyltransferase
MDVVILCGGKGTRLSEETVLKPKPMVEIGGMPILWHIMKIYSYYGFKRFILALGYKGDQIKQYFYNYRITSGDLRLKLNPDTAPTYFNHSDETDWEITFVDTGQDTLKGGRIKRIEKYIQSSSAFQIRRDGFGRR